ncbi:MAG: hypothetical protein HY782_02240 [Chloroflexi bacterium]|nr:hypothetical protein [Chloroflexota bacterium]
MPQVKRYQAKKDLKLDCGHTVKAGETFVVTKTFTCEEDAKQLAFKKDDAEPKAEKE